MTVGPLNPSPARLLLLLQGPVFDKRRLNRAARPPWSRSSSFPLATPPPPLPQTATPQRVRWRRKALLPSVGSRWSPSPVFLCNFPLHLPSFLPSPAAALLGFTLWFLPPPSVSQLSLLTPNSLFLFLLLLHPLLLLCARVGKHTRAAVRLSSDASRLLSISSVTPGVR